MKIKVNYDNDYLFCFYSKERIELGERYVLVEEDCLGEIVKKVYKIENCPEDEEENEVYIGE